MEFPYMGYDALICDGAVRSGKTSIMTVSFFMWAMNNFNNCAFAFCGKSVGAVERNIIQPFLGIKKERFFAQYNRGEHMRKIRGDVYSAGISSRGNAVAEYKNEGVQYFRHKLKPIKIGVQMKDKKAIDDKMRGLLKKYAVHIADQVSVKEKSDS